MNLESLIGSADWTRLQCAFREKLTAIGTISNESHLPELWPDWLLDAILRFAALPSADSIRLLMKGKEVNPALYRNQRSLLEASAVERLLQAGGSISLTRVEGYSNALLSMSRLLEAAFHCPVQCNLYVTPAREKGLGEHVDSHDVLALQISGEKRWELEDATCESGVRSMTLSAGNWMFLPQGIRHDVSNRHSETSVHITVGFHPFTWGEALQRALKTARKQSRQLNAPIDLSTELPPDAIESRLRELHSFVDPRTEAPHYYGNFRELETAIPQSEIASMQALASIQDSTKFEWIHESASPNEARGFVSLELPYRREALALRPELAAVVRTMREKKKFHADELSMASPSQAVLLCRFLSSVAFLRTSDRAT